MREGIIHSGGCTLNCMKLRIDAGDKSNLPAEDKAVANAHGDKFIIPLNFEMLDSTMPCYQSGLGNRLCYSRVSKSTGAKQDASYKILDISLEYEIVTQPDLTSSVSDEYQNMAMLYHRVLRHGKIAVNKLDMTWNWSFNTPCRPLKSVLILFEAEQPYT